MLLSPFSRHKQLITLIIFTLVIDLFFSSVNAQETQQGTQQAQQKSQVSQKSESPQGANPQASPPQGIAPSRNQPITITAVGGFQWNQNQQSVTAYDNAKAVRGDVTITADRLTAYYRKKSPSQPAQKEKTSTKDSKNNPKETSQNTEPHQNTPPQEHPPQSLSTENSPNNNVPPNTPNNNAQNTHQNHPDSGQNEIYRLEAEGHVHIFTKTDQAWSDKAVYDIDNAVLVMTGNHLRLTTPQDVLTARDMLEYYTQKHMAIGRGNATITTTDHRQIRADVLVSYGSISNNTSNNNKNNTPSTQNVAQTSNRSRTKNNANNTNNAPNKLEKVTAFGHIWLRTPTEIVTGDRGIYIPDTGLARVVGNVHITRGANQIEGGAALVNLKTGTATITGKRVSGLVVPNKDTQQ